MVLAASQNVKESEIKSGGVVCEADRWRERRGRDMEVKDGRRKEGYLRAAKGSDPERGNAIQQTGSDHDFNFNLDLTALSHPGSYVTQEKQKPECGGLRNSLCEP